MITPSFLTQYQCRVQQKIDQLLQDHETPKTLLKAMRYSSLNGGKRIRAALVYATGKYCQADETLLDDAAKAIEIMHAFSLIHDDLPAMDNDQLRRGKPTCHIAFNEAAAILAGDALQTLSFEVLSQPDQHIGKRLQMVNCLAKASGSAGMAGGQWLDIDATDKTLALDKLTHMHHLKTGKLISAAVALGIISSGLKDETTIQTLAQYAHAIGIGFQICDDILDVTASTDSIGKTAGKDIDQNKSTFVTLLGLEEAKHQLATTLKTAEQALQTLSPPPQELVDLAKYMISRNY